MANITKLAISKNYFHWVPWDGKVYDQRLVKRYLRKGLDRAKIPAVLGLDPNDIDTNILVYEDRVKEWFLEIGKRLKQDNEAGFVILQIAVGYIEGNQQYREGRSSESKSGKFFNKAMKRVFPDRFENESSIFPVDRFRKKFYKGVRCGLFHSGMTTKGVSISGDFNFSLRMSLNTIQINPHKFLDAITRDFETYILQLKDPNNVQLRRNFKARWSETG